MTAATLPAAAWQAVAEPGETDPSAPEWPRVAAERVLDHAGSLADAARSPDRRELVREAVVGLRERLGAAADKLDVSLHLPLLVHHGLAGAWEPAVPLAAATALHGRCAELLDHLQDDDVARSAASVLAAAAETSGGRLGTYVETAALLAGADGAARGAARALGTRLGTARRLAADAAALLGDPAGRALPRALARGPLPYPLAAHSDRLAGAERTAFLALLDRAHTEPAARDAVRDVVAAGGALRETALRVEVEVQAAFAALDALALTPAARGGVAALVRRASVVGRGDA